MQHTGQAVIQLTVQKIEVDKMLHFATSRCSCLKLSHVRTLTLKRTAELLPRLPALLAIGLNVVQAPAWLAIVYELAAKNDLLIAYVRANGTRSGSASQESAKQGQNLGHRL